MFNSSFAREMTDYLELRTAVLSASSASNDRRVLLLLDQYLVLSGFQGKELTEDILSAWSKTLSGKSKTVKEKLAVVRGFGKYLNTLGHQSFLQRSLRLSRTISLIFFRKRVLFLKSTSLRWSDIVSWSRVPQL